MSLLTDRRRRTARPWWVGAGRAPLDGVAWVMGFAVAAAARYDFTTSGMNRQGEGPPCR